MVLFLFILFCYPIVSLAQIGDTIYANKLHSPLLEELNYYQIQIKSFKNSRTELFVGLDLNSLQKALINKVETIKKIQFFSEDNLMLEIENHKDTNFVWLIQKKKFETRDTLRYSESKKIKKIEMSEVYKGYKFLNPTKILIKTKNSDLDSKNLNYSAIIFSRKKMISIFWNITKIVIIK